MEITFVFPCWCQWKTSVLILFIFQNVGGNQRCWFPLDIFFYPIFCLYAVCLAVVLVGGTFWHAGVASSLDSLIDTSNSVSGSSKRAGVGQACTGAFKDTRVLHCLTSTTATKEGKTSFILQLGLNHCTFCGLLPELLSVSQLLLARWFMYLWDSFHDLLLLWGPSPILCGGVFRPLELSMFLGLGLQMPKQCLHLLLHNKNQLCSCTSPRKWGWDFGRTLCGHECWGPGWTCARRL